jgi:hypothetical protein
MGHPDLWRLLVSWEEVAVEDDLLLVGAEAVGEGVFVGHGEGALPLLLEGGGVFFEEALEVGNGVDEIEFAGGRAEGSGEVVEAALEDGSEEGVVEVKDDGTRGVVEGGGVAVVRLDVAAVLPGSGEALDVGCCCRAELRSEFDADDAVEGEARGEQEGAAFAAAKVDEGEAGPVEVEGVEDLGEERGRDAVVGGAPEVVAVAGGEVLAPDDSAGVGAVGEVEGMDEIGGGGGRVAGDDKRGGVAEVESSRDLLEDGDAEAPRAKVHEGLKDSSHYRSGHG